METVTRTYLSKIIKARNVPQKSMLEAEMLQNRHLLHCMVRDLGLSNRSPNGTSWHVYYKEAYGLTDYLVTSLEASAKGIRKNASENLKNHMEELESQISQIDKRIKELNKQIANMEQVKKSLVARSKARKSKRKNIPKVKNYKGSGITEENGVFTVKHGKQKPKTFGNEYLFELHFVNP